jgi:O-antigen ligase
MSSKIESAPAAERLLYFLFLLAIIWVPLPSGSIHLWSSSLFEAWVLLIASAWIVLLIAGRVELTLAFRRAWPALALFIGVYLLVLFQLMPLPATVLAWLSPSAADIHATTWTATTIALDPAATRAAALKTLTYGVLFALTLVLVDSRTRLRRLAHALIFSGVFQAAYGALMTLSGLEYGFFVIKDLGTGSSTGTFANANHFAGYLEMCLGIGVGLMLADMSTRPATSLRESLRRFLHGLLGNLARVRLFLVIMVTGIVLSKSRMGNVAFFSSLIMAGMLYAVLTKRFSRGMLVFFISVVLIDILIIGNYFGIDKVAEELREGIRLDASMYDMGYRAAAADGALQIVRDYPLTGAGAGSFASVYPMYDDGDTGDFFWEHAHNDYLQFAGEFGLPGFAMLGGIVLMSVWMAIAAQLHRRDQMMRGMACGILMAIVAILLHTAIDFNLQIPANAATFVVILAMAWVARWMRSRHE